MDCLSQEQYKDHLKNDLTRLMASVSQQKLAQIVAELIVNGVDRNPKDDLNRIDVIIQTKNTMNALQLGLAYSNQ
jgi:DNA gyrase/topoisomerase IV subunit B